MGPYELRALTPADVNSQPTTENDEVSGVLSNPRCLCVSSLCIMILKRSFDGPTGLSKNIFYNYRIYC